jgi:hypothetical protein
MLHSTDYTWTISEAMYWSVIECSVGIIAACIPSFKALARRYLPRILGEYSSANRDKYNKHIEKEEGNGGQGCLRKIDSYAGRSSKEGSYMTDEIALKDWRRDERSEIDEGEEKDFVTGKGGLHTMVELDTRSQESFNHMQVPDGKIIARTEIVRHVEDV